MKTCNQCGKCCTKYGGGGLAVSTEEIDSWELFNPTLRDYVQHGDIWFSPTTGEPLEQCPWLIKLENQPIYQCQIYLDRPNDCRYYPVSVGEMVRDGCEMIETTDITNLSKAQAELDRIMADSRPAMQSNRS